MFGERRVRGQTELQPYCKTCNNEYHKAYYRKDKVNYKKKVLSRKLELRKIIRTFLIEYAKNGCSECNEKDFRCLDFDHLDPKKKKYEISQMVNEGYSVQKVKAELKKCRIICSNCHRKHTAKQFGYYKDSVLFENK